MFNPKERLEQIRKNKTLKEQTNNFLAQNNNPAPLFQSQVQSINQNDQQVSYRVTRLEHIVSQLSNQLSESNELVKILKKENSELQTKLLKLQYENSQLKIQSKPSREQSQQKYINRKDDNKFIQTNRFESQISQDILLPEVQEALEQIKKQPVQNILKRMEQNFRALKIDPKQNANGNKYLRQFVHICKDYNKHLKKPVLVLKLNSNDFQ